MPELKTYSDSEQIKQQISTTAKIYPPPPVISVELFKEYKNAKYAKS
jgi:hypothetical protein